MHEKLVIVPKKTAVGKKLLSIVLFIITCVFFILSILAPVVFFLTPAMILAVVWFLVAFRTDIEYEYTYYDGEMRFAKIRAKSKRKGLGRVSMDDVIMLAPKGDRSVYKYENDNGIAYKNLTSGETDAKVYELVFKGEKGINRYEIEPDEEMLDEIIKKYARLVIK